MAFAKEEVGDKMVDGVAVAHTDAEAQVIADKWNANETTQATKQAADNAREGRLTALGALISNRMATLADMLEYTSLRDGLEI